MSNDEYSLLIDKLDKIIELMDGIDSLVGNIEEKFKYLNTMIENLIFGVAYIREFTLILFLVLCVYIGYKLLWTIVFKNS